MTHPEKTLAGEISASDVAVLSVVATGLLAMVCSAGWQVTWLIALAVVALLRRQGIRLSGALGTPRTEPHGPDRD